MKKGSPKLPLTSEERTNLRRLKVKLAKMADMEIASLKKCLGSSLERAKYLKALAEFQSVPSIGPKIAQGVVEMGYYSLDEVKNKDGSELINQMEEHLGCWQDPCVEDSLRCIVHFANDRESDKNWWDFTSERKRYREQFGYPVTRPTKAWHEVEG